MSNTRFQILRVPVFESRHNLKYWHFAPYFSFGVSAHSFDGENLRSANERDTFAYVKKIEASESPIVEKNELDENTRRAEYAFLHLRLNEGIDLKNYKEKFGIDLAKEYAEDLARLTKAGLIELTEDNLRLSKKGGFIQMKFSAVFCLRKK